MFQANITYLTTKEKGALHCMKYLYVFLGNNTACEANIVFNCSHMVSSNTLYFDVLCHIYIYIYIYIYYKRHVPIV